MESKTNLKDDIVKEIHQIFLNSMETRYKEVLTFLGFLLPALTAFILLSYNFNINQNIYSALKKNGESNNLLAKTDSCDSKIDSSKLILEKITYFKDSSLNNLSVNINNYHYNQDLNENNKKSENDNQSIIFTFFLGTLVILFILTWGAIYSLAVSYRYRYLQASVYLIEETTGANNYIPSSFKPRKISSINSRLFLDISPSILQVNIHFLALSIIGITIVFNYLTIVNYHYSFSIIITLFAILFLTLIYYIGGWRYPQKMEKIITDLEQKLGTIKKEEKVTNIII